MRMRSRSRRRSVSSCVSPGPRRPIPPFWRSRWVQPRTRRVDMCRSCASSTCSLPSCERARCAKMSRISPVRSSTRQPSARSRLRSCEGLSAWLKMTSAASCAPYGRLDLGQLAGADEMRGIGAVALAEDELHRIAARGQHQLLEFAGIFLRAAARQFEVNEHRALTALRAFEEHLTRRPRRPRRRRPDAPGARAPRWKSRACRPSG